MPIKHNSVSNITEYLSNPNVQHYLVSDITQCPTQAPSPYIIYKCFTKTTSTHTTEAAAARDRESVAADLLGPITA
jgi:hypothetical protein